MERVTLDFFPHPDKINRAARHGGPAATKTIPIDRARRGAHIGVSHVACIARCRRASRCGSATAATAGAVGDDEVREGAHAHQRACFGMGGRNFVEVSVVRACREMSLVVVSRFFGSAIQMNFPGGVFPHQRRPERAGG